MSLPTGRRSVATTKRTTVMLFATISLMATAVLGVWPQAAFADGRNSATAHACEQGGSTSFVRSEGSTFANTGQCVDDDTHGGELVPAILTATFVVDPSRGGFEDLTVTGSGLLPGSTVSYSFHPFFFGARTRIMPTIGNSTVASDGTFSTGWGTGCPVDHGFEFYATTASGNAITATGCLLRLRFLP
jgi:hypothetical protein